MKTASSDGHPIAYSTFGNPDHLPVVLIQGFGMPSYAWLNLPLVLSERGFYVITPDNRGTGKTPPSPGPTMSVLASDINAILAQEFQSSISDRKPLIAGISMGGMIAQQYALSFPNELGGLLLAATTARGWTGISPSTAFLMGLSTLFKKNSSLKNRLYRKIFHEKALEKGSPIPDQWTSIVQQANRRVDVSLQQARACFSHHTVGRLKNIQVPVLILHGEADRLISPRNSEFLHREIPHSTYKLLPECGHIFPLERPEAFIEGIQDLAQRVKPKQ